MTRLLYTFLAHTIALNETVLPEVIVESRFVVNHLMQFGICIARNLSIEQSSV